VIQSNGKSNVGPGTRALREWLGVSVYDYFTEMCSGFEAGSYVRLIDFVNHSTLGLRLAKKKIRCQCRSVEGFAMGGCPHQQ
jgi:hypothetical protein